MTLGTVLAISAGIGAAGSVMSAFGARDAAKDARKQLMQQKQVAAYQAVSDLTELNRTLEATLDGQIVMMASRGLGTDSPSFQAILDETLSRASDDARTIRMNEYNLNRSVDLQADALKGRSDAMFWSGMGRALQFGIQGYVDYAQNP